MLYTDLIEAISSLFNNISGPMDNDLNNDLIDILQNFLNYLIVITQYFNQK